MSTFLRADVGQFTCKASAGAVEAVEAATAVSSPTPATTWIISLFLCQSLRPGTVRLGHWLLFFLKQ